MASILHEYRISSRYEAIHLTSCLALRGLARSVPRHCCNDMGALKKRSRPVGFPPKPIACVSSVRSPR